MGFCIAFLFYLIYFFLYRINLFLIACSKKVEHDDLFMTVCEYNKKIILLCYENSKSSSFLITYYWLFLHNLHILFDKFGLWLKCNKNIQCDD